ncbi:MAG: acyloxyacyl hydrolase [Bdellovibrionaceae bacterium]|nr:acyloxyacyl hydrolase [Pseudobdellovibrionaceae bacterium]
MLKRIWLILILGTVFNSSAYAEIRYTEDSSPPALGWESALKFFSRSPASSNSTSSGSIGDYGDSAFFLDQTMFVNNTYVSEGQPAPKWGLNAGYEWDQSWYGTGIYVNYVNYSLAEKFSVTSGFYYPRLESGFPLYVRANIGLGYYTDDIENKGATFDYNAGLGLRFFSTSGSWLFNLEVGSRNYTRLLKSQSAESIIVGSGLAITF